MEVFSEVSEYIQWAKELVENNSKGKPDQQDFLMKELNLKIKDAPVSID
jgi:hypothetical protein